MVKWRLMENTLSSVLVLEQIDGEHVATMNLKLDADKSSTTRKKPVHPSKVSSLVDDSYKMQNLMLRRPDAVRKLLSQFQERVANIGVLELLKETKLLDPNAKDKTLYLWDEPYYKKCGSKRTIQLISRR